MLQSEEDAGNLFQSISFAPKRSLVPEPQAEICSSYLPHRPIVSNTSLGRSTHLPGRVQSYLRLEAGCGSFRGLLVRDPGCPTRTQERRSTRQIRGEAEAGSSEVLALGIQVPSQKMIGDYLCRLGGPKYLLRRYVDP